MLLEKDNSCLIVVDVQEKLTPYVADCEQLITRCCWMIRLANQLKIPVLVSEQYSRGLGHTIEPLRELVPDICTDKVHFSCFRDPLFQAGWSSTNKKQAVLIGIETHVCILQTAIDMQNAGVEVFVVVDAVSSRYELDYKYGLKRMKQLGIQLITAEMAFFEWIGQAGTAEFKALSQAFMRA